MGQQQKSENEVEKEKMTALIDIEKQRAGLIREKTANDKLEASVAGEAEGTRLAQSTLAFMGQLEKSLDSEKARAARYASNPQLTTVIEGGSGGSAAASAQVKA